MEPETTVPLYPLKLEVDLLTHWTGIQKLSFLLSLVNFKFSNVFIKVSFLYHDIFLETLKTLSPFRADIGI